MTNRKLVIVGVDPGTTVGYALVDLDGKIIEVKSSKEIGLGSLIEKVTNRANPIIVATDKKKCPGFIEKFSVKIGARIIRPQKDLLIQEKRSLIKDNNHKNSHEMDALASAFYAFKNLEQLILKINDFVAKNKKEDIEYELKRLVISNGNIGIKTAANLIENPKDKENKIVKKVIEEKKFSQNDFFRLYSEFEKLKRINSLVKQQNNTFKNELKKHRKKYSRLSKQIKKLVSEDKIQQRSDFREERIQSLLNLIRSKDDEINDTNKELSVLRDFLASYNDFVIVKKLDNLGWNEFNSRNKVISLDKGDILLVDDPNIFSHRTLGFIKKKVSIIISKKRVNKKLKDEFSCDFILSKDLDIKEERYFAFVKKQELEKRKGMKGMLDKVVDEYKKSRKLES